MIDKPNCSMPFASRPHEYLLVQNPLSETEDLTGRGPTFDTLSGSFQGSFRPFRGRVGVFPANHRRAGVFQTNQENEFPWYPFQGLSMSSNRRKPHFSRPITRIVSEERHRGTEKWPEGFREKKVTLVTTQPSFKLCYVYFFQNFQVVSGNYPGSATGNHAISIFEK